jgi:hypothetical protein
VFYLRVSVTAGADSCRVVCVTLGDPRRSGDDGPDTYGCDLTIDDDPPMTIRGTTPLVALTEAIAVVKASLAEPGTRVEWLED